VFCEGYLAMLGLEAMNESCGSGIGMHECKFFLQTRVYVSQDNKKICCII